MQTIEVNLILKALGTSRFRPVLEAHAWPQTAGGDDERAERPLALCVRLLVGRCAHFINFTVWDVGGQEKIRSLSLQVHA